MLLKGYSSSSYQNVHINAEETQTVIDISCLEAQFQLNQKRFEEEVQKYNALQ